MVTGAGGWADILVRACRTLLIASGFSVNRKQGSQLKVRIREDGSDVLEENRKRKCQVVIWKNEQTGEMQCDC